MKKLIIIMVTILFGTQYPSKAVWVAHNDFDRPNDWIESPEDETHHPIRQISIYFTKATPPETKLIFARHNKEDAKDEVEELYEVDRRIEIDFNQVSRPAHIAFIKAALERYSLEHGDKPRVYFADNAPEFLQTEWNEFLEGMNNAHVRTLEDRNRRRENHDRRYDDHLDSNSAWETDLLDQDGHFDSDGD